MWEEMLGRDRCDNEGHSRHEVVKSLRAGCQKNVQIEWEGDENR